MNSKISITYSSQVNFFIPISNLQVIVSEFYDLDVGTVKWIEIQPERLVFVNVPFPRAGWNLKQVKL